IDKRECDVFFRIDGNFGDNTVDGPSAGGAMTVATHAALIGAKIRQDVVMTGAILPGGKIGEVGGVIEKSIAASDSGAKYMLAPRLKVYEALLLSSIGRQNDFTAIEIYNISDAEVVIFSDYLEKFSSRFNPESSPLPEGLPALPKDADSMRFSKVASDIVDRLDLKVATLFPTQQQSGQNASKLQVYFRNEIENYRLLISRGYSFTAANAAFLLSIDAEYVKIGDKTVDIDGSIEDVSACASTLHKPQKNMNNLDWAIGSDLRRIWAQKKLNETIEYRADQGGYTTLRDLLFSYGWCGISQSLADQATGISGATADETKLSSLSSQRLFEAQDVLASASKPDYDAIWHYESAVIANRSGDYGASIYESTYAETMQKITSSGDTNLTQNMDKAIDGPRKSLWGKIYYSQAMFLYTKAEQDNSSFTDAYRIFKFSTELDKADDDIKSALASTEPEVRVIRMDTPLEKPGPTEQDFWVSLFLAFSIVAFGIAIIYRLVKRGLKFGVKTEKIELK
ncbi:MAG: hypothetical protein NTV88_00635, partial [Candidatus Micrarchaeota archaeon]|nr:hypothetical protein [Candidatus Micrarchaeota archaeon]